MEEMEEIVIKISEKVYKALAHTEFDASLVVNEMRKSIANGTPLPKGRGRLFDERDIVNGNYEVIGNRIYELEPIIEADKESEVKNGQNSSNN